MVTNEQIRFTVLKGLFYKPKAYLVLEVVINWQFLTFKITSSGATSTAKIVYDAVSGQLFYNQNGSAGGFGSGGLFANLTDAPTLSASEYTQFILQLSKLKNISGDNSSF